MTQRIPSATPPYSEAVQKQFDRLMPPGVPPLKLFTMIAGDARLFSRFMGGGLLDKGHLTLRQREIVIDRTTALCGSEYEWGVHVAFFAERVDLTAAQIHSLVHGDGADACWTNEEDRLLIALCDALHADCDIGDSLWQKLSAAFKNAALLELLMLAGFYRSISYLTNAGRVPLESFAARFPAFG